MSFKRGQRNLYLYRGRFYEFSNNDIIGNLSKVIFERRTSTKRHFPFDSSQSEAKGLAVRVMISLRAKRMHNAWTARGLSGLQNRLAYIHFYISMNISDGSRPDVIHCVMSPDHCAFCVSRHHSSASGLTSMTMKHYHLFYQDY